MKNIQVSEETYEKIKNLLPEEEKIDIKCYKDLVGKKLFIRTVTYHWVGKVEKIVGSFLELSTASWVADSGRFMQAIKDGKLNEVEPVGIAFVNINTATDIIPIKWKLPTEQR